MDPLRRKRKGGIAMGETKLKQSMAMGETKLKQPACLYNDGASFSSFAPARSFEECTQQRKRHKEKIMDEHLGSPILHPAAAATVPHPRRRGCLFDSPGRGLKRKVGCIDAATQFGRKKKIDSDFYMGQELGKGKFGVVRLCKNKSTGEELACKTLPKNGEENVHVEVEIMQHLSGHPNVVTLRSVYEDVESLHLVMEFCSGGRLIDSMSKNGCYSEHQAANLIKQLVAVIKYCHEMGVIHRDIKPENILLTSNGSLKLADFGLSVHVANGQHLSGVVGSPAYVAPEVLAGTYSEKVDVWGAGVLLHALLIGSLPFRGESVEAIFEAIKHVQLDFQAEKWKSVSGPAKDLLSRMLSRDVEKRLSPEEVLRHPWIMFYTEPDVKLQARKTKRKKHMPPFNGDRLKQLTIETSPSKSDSKQEREDCDLVDVLAAAILQIRISEPKRSRLCMPSYAVPQECSSNLQTTLCTAF